MEYKKEIEITSTGMVVATVRGNDGNVKGVEFFTSFIRTNKAVVKACEKAHRWANERIAICIKQENGKSDQDRLVMCGRCGSMPEEIDYSSVTDIYGVANQDADIMCSDDKCPNAVHVTFESDISGDNINRALKAAWNALNT